MTHQYMEIKIKELEERIKALELEQEPKTGHWITREVRQEEVPCCSECGSDCRDALAYGWDYCPNCGSYNGGR